MINVKPSSATTLELGTFAQDSCRSKYLEDLSPRAKLKTIKSRSKSCDWTSKQIHVNHCTRPTTTTNKNSWGNSRKVPPNFRSFLGLWNDPLFLSRWSFWSSRSVCTMEMKWPIHLEANTRPASRFLTIVTICKHSKFEHSLCNVCNWPLGYWSVIIKTSCLLAAVARINPMLFGLLSRRVRHITIHRDMRYK